jgi:hypothetical protein
LADNKIFWGEATMKTRYAVLLAMLAVFAVVLSYKSIAGTSEQGIPFPTGQFAGTLQGSFALCLNPNNPSVGESCSTAGALVVPLNFLANGITTLDEKGNGCGTYTEVDTPLPPNASMPTVTANEHPVATLLDYDPTTGTGDSSFTVYIGGSCTGATFDSTGATQISTGADHFNVSQDGNRSDFIFTKLSVPVGSFSISGTFLRQTKPES